MSLSGSINALFLFTQSLAKSLKLRAPSVNQTLCKRQDDDFMSFFISSWRIVYFIFSSKDGRQINGKI